MEPYYTDLLERLTALHTDIKGALDGLPPEALDWVAGPQINSMAVLVAHIAGAERFWIGDVVGQRPSGRDRAAEFKTTGLDAAALTARLDAALATSADVLATLATGDLATRCRAPGQDRDFTVGWALLHALEHGTTHLGHLQLLRQLWVQQATHGGGGAA